MTAAEEGKMIKSYRNLQFLFLLAIIGGLIGENVTITEVEKHILGSMFDAFESVVSLSNNFERFPMNDSYFETQYLSKTNSTRSIPVYFHQRIISLLEYYDVGSDCRADILDLNTGLEEKEDWALRMIDSFGKPTSGLVDLRLKWLGSYDECVTASVYLQWVRESTSYGSPRGNDTDDRKHRVMPQYCTASLLLPVSLVPKSSSHLVKEVVPPTVQFGVCFPDSCSETDVSRVIKAVADHVQGSDSEISAEIVCATKTSLSAGAIVLIVVLCLFGILLIIGTVYDVFLMRMKLFSKDDYDCVSEEEPLQLKEMTQNGTTSEVYETQNGSASKVNGTQNGTTPRVNGTLQENEFQIEAGNKQDVEKNYSVVDESRRQETRRQEPEGNLHIFLMAFSIIKNGEAVLRISPNTSGNRVYAIDGLRALTIGWIIMAHTFAFAAFHSDNMDMYLAENKYDWTFAPVMSPFSVDTFFMISGCLVTYLTMMRLCKDGGVRNFPWGKFYILRFWRLCPTYYFAFFIAWIILPLLTAGPTMKAGSLNFSECPNIWWSNLLFFNNFYGTRAYGCYGISWYLAADTQCYMLSPIIICLLYCKPRIGIIVSIVTMAASAVYIGVVAKIIDFVPSQIVIPVTDADIGYMEMVHMYPFSHVAPYVVGMVIGYIIHRHKNTAAATVSRVPRVFEPLKFYYMVLILINVPALIQPYGVYFACLGFLLATPLKGCIPAHTGRGFGQRWQIFGWCFSMTAIVAGVYLPFIGSSDPANFSSFNVLTALYMAPSKLVWALAVGWIVYACATGMGGIVNNVLSWGPFIVLGRLTFTTYLVHVIVLHVFHWPMRTLFHFTDIELAYTTTAVIALSFGAGFILSVCVEEPSFGLQKLFFKEKRR